MVKGFDVAVFDLLAGDDADGLRDFARGDGDFGAYGDGGGKGAVVAVSVASAL